MLGVPFGVTACLFDLDGVLTQTAKVHSAAWKQMFDDYLRERARQTGEAFVPFDPIGEHRSGEEHRHEGPHLALSFGTDKLRSRLLTKSPIDQLIEAIDVLDAEAVIALMAPNCEMLAVDGRRAEGTAAVHELLSDFLATILQTTHQISAQWHQDDVWIAEVEATYELKDRVRIRRPRAFVLRDGPHGFVELHVYGAHERPLPDHRTGEEGMRIGGQWIPPL